MASDYRATWHDEFARCQDCGHATVGLSLPYAINHPAGCAASGFDVAPPYEDPHQLACRERDEARRQRDQLHAVLVHFRNRLLAFAPLGDVMIVEIDAALSAHKIRETKQWP